MFHLRLLAPVQVEREGVPLQGFESRKAVALLCYLAMQEHPVSRSCLADLFWGDKPEARGRANLSRVLHNLSHLLPNCFLADRHTIQFRQDGPCKVDVLRFNRLIERGNSESLDRALALYRNEFMVGFYLDGCPEFENWLIEMREKLRQRVVHLLETLVDDHLSHGRYREGVRYAWILLSHDGWREEVHRKMMLLLALSGQRSAALVQYEFCRRTLAEEFDAEPSHETIALYKRILAENLEEVHSVEVPSSSALIGRDEEHAWLSRQWEAARQGRGGLTLVEGMAGIGKSRLIEEVLRYAAATGALVLQGQCYDFGQPVPYLAITEALRAALLTLQGLRTSASDAFPADGWLAELACLLPEIGELLPELTPPLPLPVEGNRHRLFEAAARFLRALSQERPLILFLDDVQWIDLPSLDLLRYLLQRLQGAPVWFLFACTPERLEAGHPLTRLQRAARREMAVARLSLGPLDEEAIRKLVRSRVVADELSLRRLATFLLEHSDGFPFILVALLEELQERGRLLPRGQKWQINPDWPLMETSAEGDEAIIPAPIRELLLDQLADLSHTSRYLLQLAALIGPQFDSGLLGWAGGVGEGVAEHLAEWSRQKLVQVTPPSTCRFVQKMLRRVILEQLSPGERKQLHGRVADALAAGGIESQPLSAQLLYHAQLSGRWASILDPLLEEASRAMERFDWEGAITRYGQALELVPLEESLARATILAGRERAYRYAGRWEAQEQALLELESLADAPGGESLAELLCRRADWTLQRGHHGQAIELAEEAARQARAEGRPDIAAESLRYGALAWSHRGDYGRARRLVQQALALSSQRGDRRGQALAKGALGVIALSQGALEEAGRALEATIGQWRALEEWWYLAVTLSTLSFLQLRQGRLSEALSSQGEARRIALQARDPFLDACTLVSLGALYHALDRHMEALAIHETAIDRAHRAAAPAIMACALLDRAHVLLGMGRVQEAQEGYRAALARQEEIELQVWRMETLNGLADCSLVTGDGEAALPLLWEAAGDFERLDRAGITDTLVRLAEANALCGDAQGAREAVERFLDLASQPASRERLTPQMWWRAGQAAYSFGDTVLAGEMLRQGDRLHRQQSQRAAALEVPGALPLPGRPPAARL